MRKVLISGIIIFLVLLIIPLGGLLNSQPPSPISGKKATEKTEFSVHDTEKENIIIFAADLCEEDFCDDGLKCALVIAKNNYISGKYKNNTIHNEQSDEFYERLQSLYDELDLTLQHKGEIVYIPTSPLSKGFTEENPQYPYIKSVASPWDCLHKDFVYDKEYSEGVSMAGLNYLCENGMNFKEALKWYLPEFSLKQTNSP